MRGAVRRPDPRGGARQECAAELERRLVGLNAAGETLQAGVTESENVTGDLVAAARVAIRSVVARRIR